MQDQVEVSFIMTWRKNLQKFHLVIGIVKVAQESTKGGNFIINISIVIIIIHWIRIRDMEIK